MSFKNTRNYKSGLIPNHCEIPGCGFNVMVTRHRIRPGRKGGKYIAGNVIGLCPNCHCLAELGHYSQYELFQIVQKRLQLQQMEFDKQVRNQNGHSKRTGTSTIYSELATSTEG